MKRILGMVSMVLVLVLWINIYTVEQNSKILADYYDEIITEELPYIDVAQKYYNSYGFYADKGQDGTDECLYLSHAPGELNKVITFDGNSIRQYSVGDYVAQFSHDEYNPLTSLWYGVDDLSYSLSYSYNYDENNNMTEMYIGSDLYYTKEYDNDLLKKITYYNGDVVRYFYDENNMCTTVTYNNTPIITYIYNEDTIIERDEINNRTTVYSQTDNGNTVSGDDWEFSSTETDYETVKTYSVGDDVYTVTLSPDYLYVGSQKIYYSRDYYGRVMSYCNYDVSYCDDEMYGCYIKRTDVGTNLSYEYSYENGNVVDVEIYSGKSFTHTYYEYDELNRIVYEYNGINNKEYNYSYDVAGNVKITESGHSICDYNNKDGLEGARVSSYNNQPVIYDEYGFNPVDMDGQVYTWTYGNRLSSVNNEEIIYDYDIDGKRIRKNAHGYITEYYYVGDNVVYEDNALYGRIYYLYDYYGDLIGFMYDGQTYFYVRDALKNIVAITDYAKNVIVEYFYNAYGQTVDMVGSKAETIGVINPYRYKGYRYDDETGFYYVGSRYYSPEIGRFIGIDDVSAYTDNSEMSVNYNPYAYANNNPIKYYDPDGRAAVLVIGGISIGIKAIIAVSAVVCIALIMVCYPVARETIELRYSALGDFFNACKGAKLSFWERRRKSPRLCKHHIVAKIDRRAEGTREIVRPYLDVFTDERNLIDIKERFHQKLHTTCYYTAQFNCFAPLKDQEFKVLNMLKIQKIIIGIINYTA